MKTINILSVLLFLVVSNFAKAQTITLTASANPAASGSAITFTVHGETTSYYVTNIIFDYPSSSGFGGGLAPIPVSGILSSSGQSATTFKSGANNTSGAAASVTFGFQIQLYSATLQSYTTVTGTSTVTINAATTTAPTDPTGYPNGGPNSNAIYRLYSLHYNVHFYTTSKAEMESLLQDSGWWGLTWAYEGVIGYTYNQPITGTVPLYRFVRTSTGEHMYTDSGSEASSLSSQGFAFESVMGYVYATSTAGTEPMYRYNSSNGHFFTTSFSEVGNGNSTYTYEGIAAYLLTTAQ